MNPLFQIIPMWTPFLPTNCNKPPTIYSLLQSIVNYDADNYTTTSNLASAGRTTIFDFDYPLSTHESKEKFECMILNHFMMRRIGYETLTAFKLALNVKLNEIMQNYNLLFDALYNWNLFDNGETITRNVTDSRSKTGTKSGNGRRESTENGSNSSTDSTTLSGTTSDSNTSDRRSSNMPNNQIANVQNGSYLSDYNYDTNTGSGTSSSTGSSTSSGTNTNAFSETKTNAENTSLTDAGTLTETITKTNDDSKQLDNLIKFTKDRQNIYTMIFKDLDVLFYQLD